MAFMVGALIPVLPFLFHLGQARFLAGLLCAVALALTGALRSRYSRKPSWRSAAEMVGIGLIGAAAGLVIGQILSSIP